MGKYLPEVTDNDLDASTPAVNIDINQPMDDIPELSKLKVTSD